VLYDPDQTKLSDEEIDSGRLHRFPVPLDSIVKELGARPIVRNTVAVGAAVGILSFDLSLLTGAIQDTFSAEIARTNVEAATKGYDYSRENFPDRLGRSLTPVGGPAEKVFLLGNEAVAIGAVRAGCRFYAAYPMTPSTGVLHFMAAHERDLGMLVLQPENEIAAINMVAGASYAGARAMTATSGGGFSLMSECLGMLGMTETPAVILVAQRPGPSTGLPTYSSQSDLRFVINASQGEFPRVVIILTDKYLSESYFTVEGLNQIPVPPPSTAPESKKEGYSRYRVTESGVSERLRPGTPGVVVRYNADEHDEDGFTREEPEIAKRMQEKRLRKRRPIEDHLRSLETVKVHGALDSDTVIVGWGSTKGPILDAIEILREKQLKVGFLQVLYLEPFPAEKVAQVIGSKKVVDVENNATGQLASLIRENLGIGVDEMILRYDGRPFEPVELAERIEEVL